MKTRFCFTFYPEEFCQTCSFFFYGPVLYTYTNHPLLLATAAAPTKPYLEMKFLALRELNRIWRWSRELLLHSLHQIFPDIAWIVASNNNDVFLWFIKCSNNRTCSSAAQVPNSTMNSLLAVISVLHRSSFENLCPPDLLPLTIKKKFKPDPPPTSQLMHPLPAPLP